MPACAARSPSRAYAEVLKGYHLGPMGDRLVELLTQVRDGPRRQGLEQ